MGFVWNIGTVNVSTVWNVHVHDQKFKENNDIDEERSINIQETEESDGDEVGLQTHRTVYRH